MIHGAGSSHTRDKVWKRWSLWFPLKKKLEEGSSHPLTYLSVCLPLWSLLHFWLKRLFLSVTLRLLTKRRMGQKSSFQFYLTVILRRTEIGDIGGQWDLTLLANMVIWMIIMWILFFFCLSLQVFTDRSGIQSGMTVFLSLVSINSLNPSLFNNNNETHVFVVLIFCTSFFFPFYFY